MEIVLLIGLGLVASYMAGLFGIGGGILLMPSLFYLFSHTDIHAGIDPIHLAINTSMVITFLNAALSFRQQIKYKNVDRNFVLGVLPGTLIGVFLGVFLSHLLNSSHLQLLAGILFLSLSLLTAWTMLSYKKAENISRNRLAVLGFVASMPASFLGLGGGSVLVPLLNHFGLDIKKVVGVSVASTVVTLFITLIITISLGYFHDHTWKSALSIIDWKTILCISPVMFLGVWLGSRTLQKINPLVSRAMLSVLLAALGVWVMF